jgi:pimeloyl-ACP methyl ester carboxylesterase
VIALLLLIAAVHATPTPPAIPEAYTHAQRLVDIGNGRKMNVYCVGVGSPTVIFDAGLEIGSGTLPWRYVQPVVARYTRACSYDRAGDGFSDPGPLPRDSNAVVSDLHALLDRAGIAPPYVLVAHSIAGLYAPLFAARFPTEVVGMVLVDPSAPGQQELLSSNYPKYPEVQAQQVASLHKCADDPKSPQCVDPASELDSFGQDGAELNGALHGFGTMPVIVLTATDDKKAMKQMMGANDGQVATVVKGWTSLHDQLAAQSSRGINCVIDGTGHYIQVDKPQAVVDAILQVMTLLQQPSVKPTCPVSASATSRPATTPQRSRSSQKR